MNNRKIRAGLVGCGQIADAHLQQIRRIAQAEVVAVCDVEPLLARQAAERFRVPRQFTSFPDMVASAKPDVVHVTTPVQTHASITKELLSLGVHVYVEKPFTTNLAEARDVLNHAQTCQRHVCLGHDQLFDPIWLECRERLQAGVIGDVQHVDSVLSYPLDGPFGALVMRDPNHWVRRLPGGLFQNTMSHPLYFITDVLQDSSPDLWAKWFQKRPEAPFPSELRVHLRGEKVTGTLLFTSTTRPLQRLIRLYGTKAGLEVDLNAQQIRVLRNPKLPGALGKVETALTQLRESVGNLRRILSKFSRGRLHYFNGMRTLMERFYLSILRGDELPIPYSEMLRVTELMDRIFLACRSQSSLPFTMTDFSIKDVSGLTTRIPSSNDSQTPFSEARTTRPWDDVSADNVSTF